MILKSGIAIEIILLIDQQIKQYKSLNKWFQSPLGKFVAKEFSQQLASELDYLKGDTLVQLGTCCTNSWLTSLDFTHKWIISPSTSHHKVQLVSSLDHTPFARNSIDCILAPLSIESLGLDIVDEIDRILKPMGHIILFSINPWSLWGGAMKCGLLSCFAHNRIKMKMPFTLNRNFLQRGYKQCALINFCYIPPVNNQSLLKKLIFLDEMGKMLWPLPSGFYCYIAQKYEYIMPTPPPVIEDYKTLQPIVN